MSRRILLFLTGTAIASCVHGQLIMQNDPNVLVFGDFVSANTEVNGALWVGGTLTVSNFGVGKDLAPTDTAAGLVVGGHTSWHNGQVFNGDAYLAGSRTLSGFNVANGSVISGLPAGTNFQFFKEAAAAVSQEFAGYAATAGSGGILQDGGNRILRITAAAGLNVLNVSAADLAKVQTFQLSGDADASVIINVSGGHYAHEVWTGINPNSFSGGLGYSNILFNFSDATSVNFAGWTGLGGTILAPNAHVQTTWSSLRGNLIAGSYQGHTEFYEIPSFVFDNPLTPVPEPSAIGFVAICGLSWMIWARGRRKALPKVP